MTVISAPVVSDHQYRTAARNEHAVHCPGRDDGRPAICGIRTFETIVDSTPAQAFWRKLSAFHSVGLLFYVAQTLRPHLSSGHFR
jgi:hypothetical protein